MPIYFDHNATSPMHADVSDALLPFLSNPVGNPPSLHSYGRMARSAIESARARVAQSAWLEITYRRHHLERLITVFESK